MNEFDTLIVLDGGASTSDDTYFTASLPEHVQVTGNDYSWSFSYQFLADLGERYGRLPAVGSLWIGTWRDARKCGVCCTVDAHQQAGAPWRAVQACKEDHKCRFRG